MIQFVLGEHEYQSGNIPVFTQNNIVKRITPFVGAFAGVLGSIKKDPTQALKPLADALSSMSDADSEYILSNCLLVTKRKQGDIWIPMWVPGGGLNCQDIKLLELYEITFHVLKDNLSDFFTDLVRKGYVPISLLET